MVKKIFFVLAALFFITSVVDVYAVDYSSVTLNKLNEIRNNQSLLETVKSVTITYEDDLLLVDLLAMCKNIESLTIAKATINDLTFINNIKPNNNFSLRIESGYYNMTGLSNNKITSINIVASFLQNFIKGMSFPNLETLAIYSVDGYDDIDYSIYTQLKSLHLSGIAINDYQLFFQQLGTLTKLDSLGIANCNLLDADTKYLKKLNKIKDLNLEGCDVSDISFLEEMPLIEVFRPPMNTKSLNVIRKLPNLKAIYWRGYEQLCLTDDLIQYLDNNNISHNKYDSTLKQTLLNMINEMNIDDSMPIKKKIEKVVDYVHTLKIVPDVPYNEEYSDNGLLYIAKFKYGLCHQYSVFEHALLKLIGIDSNYIEGILTTEPDWRHLDPNDEFYLSQRYEIIYHAWLMVKDENNIWYGWDPLNIDGEDFELGKKMYFWKKPYDDGGVYEYNNPLYNNRFHQKYIVTNKTGYKDYLQQVSGLLAVLLENNGYNVSGIYVSKFKIGDSISSIKKKLGNDVTIETDKSIISTGAVIKKGNESYTVVIKGDLNGDGKANSGDLLQMRKYLLEEINLTGAYKQAGIIESNNGIKSLDLLRLRQYLLGEYTFK